MVCLVSLFVTPLAFLVSYNACVCVAIRVAKSAKTDFLDNIKFCYIGSRCNCTLHVKSRQVVHVDIVLRLRI